MHFKNQLNTAIIYKEYLVFSGFSAFLCLQWNYLAKYKYNYLKNTLKMHLNGTIVSNIKKASTNVNAFVFALILDFFIFSILVLLF
ncbi:MAG: hypothetical protein C0525_01545 [Flavobacterium sp.]|nr:hypothetical protein [Flavobacterium sp.]